MRTSGTLEGDRMRLTVNGSPGPENTQPVLGPVVALAALIAATADSACRRARRTEQLDSAPPGIAPGNTHFRQNAKATHHVSRISFRRSRRAGAKFSAPAAKV